MCARTGGKGKGEAGASRAVRSRAGALERGARDEGRVKSDGTRDEGEGTREEGRWTRDEGQGTTDEGRGTRMEVRRGRVGKRDTGGKMEEDGEYSNMISVRLWDTTNTR